MRECICECCVFCIFERSCLSIFTYGPNVFIHRGHVNLSCEK